VAQGLRSFVLDPETNPGRTNLFELDGRIVVVDYAHNEAGMAGLVETCRGLCPPGGETWLAFGMAGDRSDEILHGVSYLAARGADHIVITEQVIYLRGRDRQDLLDRLMAGAIDGGATEFPLFEEEIPALEWMLQTARRGDVVAITALAQRPEIFAFMKEYGATRIGPNRVRQLVRRSKGDRVESASTPG
jgi:UDP-N-acetylmuramyl tripeptide synthase